MIPLSRLLVASLYLHACGCLAASAAATGYGVITYDDRMRAQARDDQESEAEDRCEKKHPGVPDECPKGDKACERKVDAFNKCVDRQLKKMPAEDDD